MADLYSKHNFRDLLIQYIMEQLERGALIILAHCGEEAPTAVTTFREQLAPLIKVPRISRRFQNCCLLSQTQTTVTVPRSVCRDLGQYGPLDVDFCPQFSFFPHICWECCVISVPFMAETLQMISIALLKNIAAFPYVQLCFVDWSCNNGLRLINDGINKTLPSQWAVWLGCSCAVAGPRPLWMSP